MLSVLYLDLLFMPPIIVRRLAYASSRPPLVSRPPLFFYYYLLGSNVFRLISLGDENIAIAGTYRTVSLYNLCDLSLALNA